MDDSLSVPAPQPVVSATYAGFWRRFAGLFLDSLVVGAISFILQSIFGDSGLGTALGVIIGLVYYVYFFTSTGQTLGAKVMGIKVVDANGGTLSTGSAVVRVIGAYVSGMILGIGYLMMLWDGKKQTLHDKMASSFVVTV